MRHALLALSILGLAACGGGGGRTDTGPVPTDTPMSGTDTPRADAPVSTDPCASDVMGSPDRVGCNGGFVSGDPAANTAGGTCTAAADPMMMPAGSCMGSLVCSGEASMMGRCIPLCTPGATYISTGGCPTGWRCFDLSGNGVCFRDCDATHACPAGQMCDGEGSCVTMM